MIPQEHFIRARRLILKIVLAFFFLTGLAPCLARQGPLPPAKEGKSPVERALGAIAVGSTDLFIRPDLVDNPYASEAFRRWMKDPLKAPMEAQGMAMGLLRSMERPDLWLRELASLGNVRVPRPLPLDKHGALEEKGHPPRPFFLPAPLDSAVQLLLEALETADKKLAAIRDTIPSGDRALIEKYLFPAPCTGKGEDEEAPEPDQVDEFKRALKVAGQMDRRGILEAGLTVTRAILEAVEILKAHEEEYREFRTSRFMTDLGPVIIGGTRDDRYEDDAALIIDLGGNDLYKGRVASGTNGKCAVVLDLGGDDLYVGENFTQGAGLWGIGILFDLEGDDIYRAKNCSQGAGLFGLGLLLDGAGNDSFLGGSFVQAAASWGWGGLMELAGNDLYRCRHSGQAFSQVLGVACLSDQEGNDRYLSGMGTPDPREPDMNQSLSQGFAIGRRNLAAGGLALLADQWGNDLYECQYFGQGASYWMGVGVLYDAQGKDTYVARRYAQGAGIHFSFGLLMDAMGDDHVCSWKVSQGCGHDYGVGLLVNESGDDTYVSGWLSQGASNANGIGVFVDNSGDDGYETNGGMAVGKYEPERRAGGVGLFVDAGGMDRYSTTGANNRLWVENRWGVGIDEEARGISGLNLVHPEEKPPLDAETERMRKKEQEHLEAMLLTAESLSYPENIEEILSVAAHWGLEKEIPETAKETLLRMPPRETVPDLVKHLNTPDTLVLIFFNRFFPAHAFSALPALIGEVHNSDPLVRSRALYFLGRLKDPRALGSCSQALEDRSWRIRSSALRAIGDMLDRGRLRFLLPMKKALDGAVQAHDPDILKEFLVAYPKGGQKAMSVLVRAVPLEYEVYEKLSANEDRAFEAQASLLFQHRNAVSRLLEGWIRDIQNSGELAPKMMDFLDDRDPAVKGAAAYALGQTRVRDAIPKLMALLNNDDLRVRDAAAGSLALFEEAAVDPLARAMEYGTSAFKIIALDVLSTIPHTKARALIEKSLQDPDPMVRGAAARALAAHPMP